MYYVSMYLFLFCDTLYKGPGFDYNYTHKGNISVWLGTTWYIYISQARNIHIG